MRTRVRTLAAALSAALLLAACGPVLPGGAAAMVGDARIPRAEVERAIAALDLAADRAAIEESLPADLNPAERRAQADAQFATVVQDLQRRTLDLYIRLEIVRIVAEEEGVEATDVDRAEARELLVESIGGEDQLEGVLTQSGFTEDLFDEVIVEQEALIAALRTALLGDAELEVREPRHILVEDEAEAQEIVDLLAGGADFASLAEERSIDPGSAAEGGALEAAPRGAWLQEFDDAVWTAEVGEVVGPVQTQAGFHVIELLSADTLDAEQLPDEQVQQLVGGELDARFVAVVADTEVVVDPAFGEWSQDPNDPSLRPLQPVGQAPDLPAPGEEPGLDGLEGLEGGELTEEELEELLEQLESGS